MTVKKGLKTLVEALPEFSNQGVQNLIDAITKPDGSTYLGFAGTSKLLHETIDANAQLTASQKTDIKEDIDTNPHLDIGRALTDLDVHTANLLTGALGETVADDDASETGTFLEHVATVQSFVATIPFIYGYTADSTNKGIPGHFGTVYGTIDAAMTAIAKNVALIHAKQFTTDTAYQTAMTNLITFIGTVSGDSTDFLQAQNRLTTAVNNAATAFNTALNNGATATARDAIITALNTVTEQVALEAANLGSIRTYATSLATANSFVGLAENADTRKLMIRSSRNENFKTYFENYAQRSSQRHPLYTGVLDSSEEIQVQEILKLKGLPDVTDYQDLDAVASKATKDDRLKTTVSFDGKNTEQIINAACDFLLIEKGNKDIYGLSRSLLANLNDRDVAVIKAQLALNQDIDILS